MKVVWVVLAVTAALLAGTAAYDQGVRAGSRAHQATLCQDALARRRQAEAALAQPPPGGDLAYLGWQQARDSADNAYRRAEANARRLC